MGNGLWFRYRDREEGKKCDNCRQNEADGSDGLCTGCRSASARRVGATPVPYDLVFAKPEAGAK